MIGGKRRVFATAYRPALPVFRDHVGRERLQSFGIFWLQAAFVAIYQSARPVGGEVIVLCLYHGSVLYL
jgi:hypothetical protein